MHFSTLSGPYFIMSAPYPPQYYRDYLQLNKVLNAQDLKSAEYGNPAHDEMLFIITHQTFELWFKQILFEMEAVRARLSQEPAPEHEIALAFHRFRRVCKILDLAVQQFDILETMTSLDFLDFRDYLNPASGFQSLQFRLLEIALGLQDSKRLNIGQDRFTSRLDPDDIEQVRKAQTQTSLYKLVERWLERLPFAESDEYNFLNSYRDAVLNNLEKDRQALRANADLEAKEIEPQLAQIDATAQSFAAMFDADLYNELQSKGLRTLSFKATRSALFIFMYRDYPLLQMPFRFLDALVEMDEKLSVWRYRHAQMVSRMIGSKIGTGGSTGHSYLVQTAIKHKVFNDITNIASYLLPRHQMPQLPEVIAQKLRFTFETE